MRKTRRILAQVGVLVVNEALLRTDRAPGRPAVLRHQFTLLAAAFPPKKWKEERGQSRIRAASRFIGRQNGRSRGYEERK